LTLERFEFRALVRLAEPSRVKSAEERIWIFPGILSMSILVPGIAVAVTRISWSCGPAESSAWATVPLRTPGSGLERFSQKSPGIFPDCGDEDIIFAIRAPQGGA
jgi:hypothetical protein